MPIAGLSALLKHRYKVFSTLYKTVLFVTLRIKGRNAVQLCSLKPTCGHRM